MLSSKQTADFQSLQQIVLSLTKGKKVVGFDVFDTLIRRRIEPEAIKDIVAQYAMSKLSNITDWELLRKQRFDLEIDLGKRSELEGFDHEFLLDDLLTEWLKPHVTTDTLEAFISEIKAYELRLEMNAIELTPGIKPLLQNLFNEGIRIIFVSDMYLPVDAIWGLLDKVGIKPFFSAGYCSSQNKIKKSTGRLFDFVLKNEQVQCDEMLFIGDNVYSDYEVPASKGITVVNINDPAEKKRRALLQLADWSSKRNNYWMGKYCREIVESIPTRVVSNGNEHYELGKLLAPSLIMFVLHIMEEARRRGFQRIAFLAREGKVFFDIYNKLIQRAEAKNEYPPAVYVYVSRKSTFLSSMKELSWEEINRFWQQYNKQTIESLLNNLSLPADEFKPYILECGYTAMNEPVTDPANDERFTKLLSHPKVKELFEHYRNLAKTNLKQYLKEEGIIGLRHAAFVDIGWKGTIQDNITRAFEDDDEFPFITGYYIGLLQGNNHGSPRSEKYGYLADYRNNNELDNVIFRNGSIFEMCTTPNHGTTIGYERTPDGIKPVLKSYEVENENFRKYFKDVFQAIDDYVEDFVQVWPLIQGTSMDIKPYLVDELRRYILYPTSKEAFAFKKYKHVESFGVFEVTSFGFKGSMRKILLQGSPLKIPRRMLDELRVQFWPEAVLKRTRIPGLTFLYDLLRSVRS